MFAGRRTPAFTSVSMTHCQRWSQTRALGSTNTDYLLHMHTPVLPSQHLSHLTSAGPSQGKRSVRRPWEELQAAVPQSAVSLSQPEPEPMPTRPTLWASGSHGVCAASWSPRGEAPLFPFTGEAAEGHLPKSTVKTQVYVRDVPDPRHSVTLPSCLRGSGAGRGPGLCAEG